MTSDADLDRESPEDVPMVLAWELAERFRTYSADKPGLGRLCAIKGVSELAYRVVADGLVDAETLAGQLDSMAAFLRRGAQA